MTHQPGFTAVEVLVTLVIAFLLVAGSYQAYGLVVGNTADANDRSVASNLAYKAMRQQAANVNTTCQVSGPINHSVSGVPLSNPSLYTHHTCPFGTTSSLTLVTTTFEYGDKEVQHAILAKQ